MQKSARSDSQTLRSFTKLLLALGMAGVASLAHANENCTYGEIDSQNGDDECKTRTEGGTGVAVPSAAVQSPSATAFTSIDICPSWTAGSEARDATLTFAEIKVATADGNFTGVLVLSADSFMGYSEVSFDWFPNVSADWSVATTPLPPAADAAVEAVPCLLDGGWPTAKYPFILSIEGANLTVSRNGGHVFSAHVAEGPLNPIQFRVNNFRSTNAEGYVVEARWRALWRAPNIGGR